MILQRACSCLHPMNTRLKCYYGNRDIAFFVQKILHIIKISILPKDEKDMPKPVDI
jgi:hypothetical protein